MINSYLRWYLPLIFPIASRRVPRPVQLHVTYINKEINILKFSKQNAFTFDFLNFAFMCLALLLRVRFVSCLNLETSSPYMFSVVSL